MKKFRLFLGAGVILYVCSVSQTKSNRISCGLSVSSFVVLVGFRLRICGQKNEKGSKT
jgi:hypothetical protein